MMPEPEVMPRCLFHDPSKLLVQEEIPVLADGLIPFAQLEEVVVPKGMENPGPDPGGGSLDPPIREGGDEGGETHPGSLTRRSRWPLVGQEGDQAICPQVPMHDPDSRQVVDHPQTVSVAEATKNPLPRGMGRCLGDAERIGSKGGQERGEPFPLPVVHGEEQGWTGSRPVRGPPRIQGLLVQAIPSSRQEAEDFPHGRFEKSAIEVGGSLDPHGRKLVSREGGAWEKGSEDPHQEGKEAELESSVQPGPSKGNRDGQNLHRLVA